MDYTAILILACIFIPLERLIPLHEGQKITRKDWLNDVFFVLFNGFFVRFGSVIVLGCGMWLWKQWVPYETTDWVRALPLWLQLIGVIVIADIGYYTAHRLSHAIPFLWRFHAVHHSIEEMDWLAAHRVHPFDQIFTNTLSFMPIYFIGFSTEAVAIHLAIYQVHALLLHANVRLRFGPLKWVIASPEYHHWHHANQREAYDKNFASQLSVIDLIAGTMFLPKHRPEQYGVSDPVPRTYPQQLLYPFISNFRAWQQRRRQKDHIMEEAQTVAEAGPTKRLAEDRIGMLAMLLVFGYLASTSLRDLALVVKNHEPGSLWALIVVSRLANIAFLGLIVWFTATRLPARSLSHGVLPKVTAVAGTFVMMFTMVMPIAQVGPVQQVLATLLSVAGLVLSCICLFRLGRSFAIAPAARRLVTTGPYAIVRHPLYAAELVAIAGVILGSGSWSVAGLGAVWLALQIARARFEEQVLSEAFPEYHEYAARVPMLVPGLHIVAPGGLSRQGS